MRKIAAILFLSAYLITNTELAELGKLGVFFTHFQEHKQANKDLSLMDFVVLHYFSGDQQDDDKARDMQLPFKTHDCVGHLNIVSLFPPSPISLNAFEHAVHQATILFDQSAIPSSYLADIWQPPKAIA